LVLSQDREIRPELVQLCQVTNDIVAG
jgi:hypothetical protein